MPVVDTLTFISEHGMMWVPGEKDLMNRNFGLTNTMFMGMRIATVMRRGCGWLGRV
jgi:hypothetical protein